MISGVRLVIAKPGGHQDPDYLVQLIDRQKVTTLQFVPSMLQLFLTQAAFCPGVKRILCAGEALPVVIADQARIRWPYMELHNLYGPTEASIYTTAWECIEQLLMTRSIFP